MRSYDYKIWNVVMDDPYMPTKRKIGSEELEPKLQNEWKETGVKKVQINFKAINTLHCALNHTEFNRISLVNRQKKFGTS